MSHPVSLRSPGGLIEVCVIPSGSTPLPLYSRLDGRRFVAGVPGSAYALRVRNLTHGRIEVIASVDGRHVLNDETAHPHDCHGLVISAHSEYTFPGWRFNDEETGDFVFGTPESAVAAQAGEPANIGVIGFAVWRESPGAVNYGGFSKALDYNAGYESVAYASPAVLGMAGTSKSVVRSDAPSLGTGVGERRHNPVGRTDFRRATGTEPDIMQIGYDTYDALVSMGIVRRADPQAFPPVPTGYERYTPVQ